MRVRPASDDDWPAIWPIWRSVVDAGGTYLWPPGTTESDARRFWMLPPPAEVLVVEDDAGAVGGTAVLKPNQPGLGDHVANASFMIDAARHGEGLGRALAEGVLDHARRAGYRAMQFNAVVATNAAAIALWKSLGFEVVGTVPGGYRYPSEGPVDLLIMYRAL
ncbi:MAG: GNAT family N-acetyltransferase [Acidimicrobiales bacterium]